MSYVHLKSSLISSDGRSVVPDSLIDLLLKFDI